MEMPVTPRERVLRLLAGKKPDRVPWFGDLDYYTAGQTVRGERPEGFTRSDDYIRWHHDLGVGFYLQGHFPFRTIVNNCTIHERHEGLNRIREIITPEGALRESWRRMPESYTEAPVEHLVKSATDLQALACLYSNTQYEPDYDFAMHRRDIIGETGILLCYVPKSPFMQLAVLEAGIETTVMAAIEEPGLFSDTLAVMAEAHGRAARIAIDSPAEALMIPENLSSEMVGPRFFGEYMREYQETRIGEIADAGKFSFIHMDGSLAGLLREECSTGVTVLEALTPEPVGDVAVRDFAGYAGNSDTIFWGGVPGLYFTEHVSDAEFERHVIEVLSIMRSEPRYVLGVADQVPPDGLERRIRRVGELAEEYGVYE